MDSSIAIAIRDIDVAIGREGGMRATAERLSAHEGGRLAFIADCEQQMPVQREFADGMVAVVGQIDALVRPDMRAVGIDELAMPPAGLELAMVIEHHNRMLATVEQIDVVLGIHGNARDILEFDIGRQLAPILQRTKRVGGRTHDQIRRRTEWLCHVSSPFDADFNRA